MTSRPPQAAQPSNSKPLTTHSHKTITPRAPSTSTSPACCPAHQKAHPSLTPGPAARTNVRPNGDNVPTPARAPSLTSTSVDCSSQLRKPIHYPGHATAHATTYTRYIQMQNCHQRRQRQTDRQTDRMAPLTCAPATIACSPHPLLRDDRSQFPERERERRAPPRPGSRQRHYATRHQAPANQSQHAR